MACGILVPQPGIEAVPLNSKCRVLSPGLPGRSLRGFFFKFLSHLCSGIITISIGITTIARPTSWSIITSQSIY